MSSLQVYAVIYGMGAPRLAESTGVSLEKARQLIQVFNGMYPGG
jgi:DNA polymerase I-like protein with 3'-5' exonuclease and polymerase domains